MIQKSHRIFMTWRVSLKTSEARALARKLRELGNQLTGCSLDIYVPHYDACPVCGRAGLDKENPLPWNHKSRWVSHSKWELRRKF